MFQGFQNWYKPQISYAIRKSYLADAEMIEFTNIQNEWNSFGAIDKFINSKSRIKKNGKPNSMYTYVKNRWNDLGSDFNPTNYFNIEYSNQIDSDGNKIYKFGKETI